MIFHVDVPIFDMAVVVCAFCNRQEATLQFCSYADHGAVIFINDNALGTVAHESGDVYMWVEDPKLRPRHVFHELVHVAQAVCEVKGMQKDDELIAYLVAWLKTEVADRLFEEETI